MTSTDTASEAVTHGSEPGRKVVKVTESMVAAARAQVTIAGKLGKPVPEYVRRIAALDGR